ncbi:MAG: CRTAC1 family protein [Planctomycetes bacterium]|nr:CRTAC1 family protein [Planctomycetota bacterium]MCB9872483.1 CRTAC1 family protein [Planctomycetota bacterium]
MSASSNPRSRLVLALLPALWFGACTDKSEGRISGVDPTNFLRFREVHEAAGISFTHDAHFQRSPTQPVAGGVACADYDGDGYLDLYVIGGDSSGNLLYRNKRDGTFEELSARAGVQLLGGAWSGSTFVDLNGDGHLDLFLCGIDGTAPCILLNKGDGTFADATPGSGLDKVSTNSYCVAFGDIDGDGDLDMFLSQWKVDRGDGHNTQHLWRNDGKAVFTDISDASGVAMAFSGGNAYTDTTFTPNFVDVDNDGDLDLVIAADLGKNRVLINDGRGNFTNITPSDVLSDHATGAAIGDYDNDGNLDWFVSGLSGPGLSGNHLYRNPGDGMFVDVTQAAGVSQGGWGWAASFADLDNDGWLDLVQVNGFGTSPTSAYSQYLTDPTRLFMNNRNGTFTEKSAALQLDDVNRGRGLVCFDFDRDGDLDLFVVNNLGKPSLWRNDGGNIQNYLTVALRYKGGNVQGIGARIAVTANGTTQIRELRSGCNYVSQNPAEAHFGLAAAAVVDSLVVTWPDRTQTTLTNVRSRQHLVVQY